MLIGELVSLAEGYEDVGAVDQAIALYLHIVRHLSAKVVADPADPKSLAITQMRLGHLYAGRRRGDRGDNLRTAITYFLEALGYYTKERDLRRWAILQMNLATAYADCADTADVDPEVLRRRAINGYGKALEVFQADTDFGDWSMASLNLGTLYAQPGDPEGLQRAIVSYRAVIEATDPARHPRAYTDASLFLATAQFRLATLQTSDDQIVKIVAGGVAAARQARAVARSFDLPAHAAKAAVNLAGLHGLLADTLPDAHAARAAIDTARTAVAEYSDLDMPRELRNAARLLSTRYFIAEAWPEFLDACKIAIDSAGVIYEEAFLLPSRDLALCALGDLHQRYALGLARAGRLREAVEATEAGRAIILAEQLEITSGHAPNSGAAEELEEQLRSLSRRKQKMESQPATKLVRNELAKLRREFDETLAELRRLPGMDNYLRPLPFEGIASLVRSGQAIVYVFCDSKGILLLSLFRTSAGLEMRSLPIPDLSLDELWHALDIMVSDTSTGLPCEIPQHRDLGERRRRLADLMQLLHHAVVAPFACSMNDVRLTAVTFVATGLTALLPFHAAQGEDGKCLLDSWDISYVPSARVLQRARLAAEGRTMYASAFVGIAPDTTLPCANVEVRQAARLFEGHGVGLAICEPISQRKLADVMRDATVILLATHGIFSASRPRDSALSLGDGTQVTVRELQHGESILEKARLVVLSACESAIIDWGVMPTEAIGLGAAFLAMGAPAVVGSLWRVEEVSTCLLVNRMLESLGCGHDVSSALRQAQLWLRDSSGHDLLVYCERREVLREEPFLQQIRWRSAYTAQPFNHSLYWGGFVLVGSG